MWLSTRVSLGIYFVLKSFLFALEGICVNFDTRGTLLLTVGGSRLLRLKIRDTVSLIRRRNWNTLTRFWSIHSLWEMIRIEPKTFGITNSFSIYISWKRSGTQRVNNLYSSGIFHASRVWPVNRGMRAAVPFEVLSPIGCNRLNF